MADLHFVGLTVLAWLEVPRKPVVASVRFLGLLMRPLLVESSFAPPDLAVDRQR